VNHFLARIGDTALSSIMLAAHQGSATAHSKADIRWHHRGSQIDGTRSQSIQPPHNARARCMSLVCRLNVVCAIDAARLATLQRGSCLPGYTDLGNKSYLDI
jgi:hypothetical protein